MTCKDDRTLLDLLTTFDLSLVSASSTPLEAPTHSDLSCGPVYVQVVFVKPGISQDNILLPQTGDSKDRSLGMVAIAEDALDNISNGSGFGQGAINVVDRNGMRERVSGEPVTFHIGSVYEETSGTAVQKSSDSLYTLSIRGLYLDI
ncbi:hypothetical protein H0H92_001559 [Tricholoma furcatifolium]|nr:hypothetical protein H0H92_001559 [Tricholoma furcatifolium]